MTKIIIAEIIPPMFRIDLIEAGTRKDCDAIDEVHKNARAMYPKLFREDDDPATWNSPKTYKRLTHDQYRRALL